MRADVELNEIGVLRRREIEARILAPVLEALGREFGRERVLEIARQAIVQIAREQGRQLAEKVGANSLAQFAANLGTWTREDALQLQVIRQDEEEFSFDVTRCRYAELYTSLGIPELGSILSCGRDYSLIEGFNSGISLSRTKTIMEGATHCDFRFRKRNSMEESGQESVGK